MDVSPASSTTFLVAGLWQATPLIRLGPGFRYGLRTAEMGGPIQDQEATLGTTSLKTCLPFW